jgi:hypothetical protein
VGVTEVVGGLTLGFVLGGTAVLLGVLVLTVLALF